MKNNWFQVVFSAAFLLILLQSCSSIRFQIAEEDQRYNYIRIEPDETVAISLPQIDPKIADEIADAGMTSLSFATQIQLMIIERLGQDNIQGFASDKGSVSLSLKITEFETGCGFCRGFFPFFGLGDSHISGSATLTTPDRTRFIQLKKANQILGFSELTHQTNDNLEAFVDSLVRQFTVPAKTN